MHDRACHVAVSSVITHPVDRRTTAPYSTWRSASTMRGMPSGLTRRVAFIWCSVILCGAGSFRLDLGRHADQQGVQPRQAQHGGGECGSRRHAVGAVGASTFTAKAPAAARKRSSLVQNSVQPWCNAVARLTFRTSRESNRANFRLRSAFYQGSMRGTSASMSFSVSSSQACMSFFALRWLAIACSSRAACSAVRVRCTSLPPRMCPHS